MLGGAGERLVWCSALGWSSMGDGLSRDGSSAVIQGTENGLSKVLTEGGGDEGGE